MFCVLCVVRWVSVGEDGFGAGVSVKLKPLYCRLQHNTAVFHGSSVKTLGVLDNLN